MDRTEEPAESVFTCPVWPLLVSRPSVHSRAGFRHRPWLAKVQGSTLGINKHQIRLFHLVARLLGPAELSPEIRMKRLNAPQNAQRNAKLFLLILIDSSFETFVKYKARFGDGLLNETVQQSSSIDILAAPLLISTELCWSLVSSTCILVWSTLNWAPLSSTESSKFPNSVELRKKAHLSSLCWLLIVSPAPKWQI